MSNESVPEDVVSAEDNGLGAPSNVPTMKAAMLHFDPASGVEPILVSTFDTAWLYSAPQEEGRPPVIAHTLTVETLDGTLVTVVVKWLTRIESVLLVWDTLRDGWHIHNPRIAAPSGYVYLPPNMDAAPQQYPKGRKPAFLR